MQTLNWRYIIIALSALVGLVGQYTLVMVNASLARPSIHVHHNTADQMPNEPVVVIMMENREVSLP